MTEDKDHLLVDIDMEQPRALTWIVGWEGEPPTALDLPALPICFIQSLQPTRKAGSDDDDMVAMVATFTDLVTQSDGSVADRVDGTGRSGSYTLQAGRWLPCREPS